MILNWSHDLHQGGERDRAPHPAQADESAERRGGRGWRGERGEEGEARAAPGADQRADQGHAPRPARRLLHLRWTGGQAQLHSGRLTE